MATLAYSCITFCILNVYIRAFSFTWNPCCHSPANGVNIPSLRAAVITDTSVFLSVSQAHGKRCFSRSRKQGARVISKGKCDLILSFRWESRAWRMSLEINRGNYTVVPSPGVPGVWSNVPPKNLKWLLCQAELFTQKALRCSSGFSWWV